MYLFLSLFVIKCEAKNPNTVFLNVFACEYFYKFEKELRRSYVSITSVPSNLLNQGCLNASNALIRLAGSLSSNLRIKSFASSLIAFQH